LAQRILYRFSKVEPAQKIQCFKLSSAEDDDFRLLKPNDIYLDENCTAIVSALLDVGFTKVELATYIAKNIRKRLNEKI